MGTKSIPTTDQRRTAVQMYWTFDDEGGISPELTIKDNEVRQEILDEHDVSSLSELQDKAGPAAKNTMEITQ